MDKFFCAFLMVILTSTVAFASPRVFAIQAEKGASDKQYIKPTQVRIYADEIQVVLDREIILVDRIFSDQAGVYFFPQKTHVPSETEQ